MNPFNKIQKDVTKRMHSRTSLAFHREGNTLKVIPFLEQKSLENKGTLSSTNDDELKSNSDEDGMRMPYNSDTALANILLPRKLERVAFQEDGSINIKLVDAKSELSNINHVMVKKHTDTIANGKSLDIRGNLTGNLGDLYDLAGSSHPGSEAYTENSEVRELKLWTYEDLVQLGQNLLFWMANDIRNQMPRGNVHTCTIKLPYRI